jgi:hypothetical protein
MYAFGEEEDHRTGGGWKIPELNGGLVQCPAARWADFTDKE